MDKTSATNRALQQAITSESFKFSVLTCLSIAGVMLILETLTDFFLYLLRIGVIKVSLEPVSRLMYALHLPEVSAFAVVILLPLFLTAFAASLFLNKTSFTYCFCAVVIYLIIIHNFRGMMPRNNVFEWAEKIRQAHSQGESRQIPDPLIWDFLHIAATLIGAALGMLCRHVMRHAGKISAGETTVVIIGILCAALGFLESLFIAFYAQPRDDFWIYPRMTQGIAFFCYGILVLLILKYRQELSQRLSVPIS